MIEIKLTKNEARALNAYLSRLVGKGSLSTQPSWAKRINSKLVKAWPVPEDRTDG